MYTQPGYAGSAAGGAEHRLSFYVDYTAITDDTGQKGGGVGQQVNLNPEYNAGKLGRFGALAFLEFFNAPTEAGDDNASALIQADYGPYWAYDIQPLATMMQIGWLAENLPRRCGDDSFTSEAFIALIVDDSKWLKTSRPVFSPIIAYYQDLDNNPGGRLDIGVNHVFPLAEMGFANTPVLRNIDVVPSFLMEMDMGQLDRAGDVDWYRWGVQVSYDLSRALKMKPEHGRVALTGFIYYRDSLIPEQIEDRFFGGITISFFR